MINIQKLCPKEPLLCGIILKFVMIGAMVVSGAVFHGILTGVWQDSVKYCLFLLSAVVLFAISEYLSIKRLK
ncbi:MAG: hypothetical protein AB7E96_02490 [Deferribacterales bacterium]